MASSEHVSDNYSTFHQASYRAMAVLQNIQDKTNCKRLKRPIDRITLTTHEKECTGISKSKRKEEEGFSNTTYENEIGELFPDFGTDTFTHLTNSELRSTTVIRNRADISDHCLVAPPSLGNSSFVIGEQAQPQEEVNSESEGDNNNRDAAAHSQTSDFFALIHFITGAMLKDNLEERTSTVSFLILHFNLLFVLWFM
jgi:hypothetical protein